MTEQKLVVKFGGSSLKNDADYDRAVENLLRLKSHKKPIIAVVSAKYGETDRLWEEVETIYSRLLHQVEYVFDAGECSSAYAFSYRLRNAGAKAKILMPQEINLLAKGKDPLNAKLVGVDKKLFNEALSQDLDFVIVPGYGAIHNEYRTGKDAAVVTLGRNSTDLIAVEIANCYNAPLYFVKSAPTIYAVSPELVDKPKEISHMTYEQALRFLEYLPQKDQFIMRKAVEHAWKKKVELIFGSLHDENETKISANPNGESGSGFKAMPVRDNIAIVSFGISTNNKLRAELFQELHKKGIKFSDRVETKNGNFRTYELFIDDDKKTMLAKIVQKFAIGAYVEVRDAALITLIDTNLDPESHHSSIEAEAFENEDIEILQTYTSGVIMHIYTAREDVNKAVSILAEKFELSKNAD